ncbi:hypothetical protein LEM9268_01966 [Leuconostoc mesenteroides]|nr:hypothetical protein C7M43_01629 [Leuconostoc mesenteroides]TDV92268.1 hypothetical protein C7818_10681 [Leuconostoc mesenteroides]SPE15338.1 hypothetical protein LEM9268_01966 [Leuconostoc mesenteroides]SPE70775.1 hypothetical protein LEM9217_01954 [Leuconostoc mesenteroides]SPI60360.1 hypothetical protein LEM9266_01886 [Leuconostoc mesenteroides]
MRQEKTELKLAYVDEISTVAFTVSNIYRFMFIGNINRVK